MLTHIRRNTGFAGLFVLLAARSALAQAPEAEDDVEIPAAPPAPPAASAPSPPPAAAAPSAAPAPEGEGDDLEIPAAAAPVEPAPPSPAPPLVAPAPPASAPASTAGASGAAETAAQPVTASPVATEPPVTAEPPRAARAALPTGNLERTAHSRPVPWGLLFSGFLQAQYFHSALSEDQLEQSGDPFNRDVFAVRAARLRLDGGHQYTAYTLELDANTSDGPSVGIRRAEGSLLYRGPGKGDPSSTAEPPLIALTAGVTDLPFGYEVVESARTRPFMERSAASEALFPTPMDAGVKLHGAWTFLRYAVALVNGEPVQPDALPRDPNAAKDLVGRFGADVRIGDRVGLAGGTSFAFGKGFHPGRVAVKDEVAWRDDNNDGVATPSELIGVPGSAASPSESFERWALGLDVQLQVETALGLTRLAAEAFVAQNHDRGRAVSDPVDVGFDLRQVGAYASLTQELGPYALVGFRADVYDPNSDFFEERRGELVPRSQSQLTLSPIVGLVLPERARLLFQYDFIRDELARDAVGVPTDADNDQLTVRLQVDL